MLTAEANTRTERVFAAAEAMFEAGAFESVDRLLRSVDQTRLGAAQRVRAELLNVEMGLAVGGADERAVLRLLDLAREIGETDPVRGQAVHLEALRLGFHSQNPQIISAVGTALTLHQSSDSDSIPSLFIRGWAQLIERGFPAGTDLLSEAARALADKSDLTKGDLPLLHFACGTTQSLLDFDCWETVATRLVQAARKLGALEILPRALNTFAIMKVTAGEFSAASSAVSEAEAVLEATGADTWGLSDWNPLDPWRLEPTEALQRIEQYESRPTPVVWSMYFEAYSRALVCNGSGRYDEALAAAQLSCDRHPLGIYTFALVELIEAAARTGQRARARAALESSLSGPGSRRRHGA